MFAAPGPDIRVFHGRGGRVAANGTLALASARQVGKKILIARARLKAARRGIKAARRIKAAPKISVKISNF